MPDGLSIAQFRAVLARLQAAYLEVALCEYWLAMKTTEAAARVRHQRRAEAANDRALEVGQDVT